MNPLAMLAQLAGGNNFLGGNPNQSTAERLLFRLVNEGNLPKVQSLVQNPRLSTKERESLINSLHEMQQMTILHSSAAMGFDHIIRWLLSPTGGRANGFKSVAVVASDGATAMHAALGTGKMKCVQALVEGSTKEELDVLMNGVDDRMLTILSGAAMEGQVTAINWLLSDSGGRAAGFRQILSRDDHGGTALHYAVDSCHLPCVIALAQGLKTENGERKTMFNAVEENGHTALHLAAGRGHEAIARWCLSDSGGRAAGFTSVLARDKGGFTALHLAAREGHLCTMETIVEGCKTGNGEREEMLNALTPDGNTILHIAAQCGKELIIRWLVSDFGGRAMGFKHITTKDKEGRTALHCAVYQGHLSSAQAVLRGCKSHNGEKEEMLNALECRGRSALLIATFCGQAAIVKWLLSDSGGRKSGLKSSTITAADKESLTLLHVAAQGESTDTFKALLSGCTSGEKLTLFLNLDEKGWSVLHHAARYARDEIIRELFLHHPETKTIVDVRDRRGMTALHRAILKGGCDLETRREWATPGTRVVDEKRIRAIEALLTTADDDDDDDGDKKKKKSSSSSKKKVGDDDADGESKKKSFVNLGIKIE